MTPSIQKELLVEASFAKHWKLFCIMLPTIEQKKISKPILRCTNRGTRTAGLYYRNQELVEIEISYIPDACITAGKLIDDVEETIAHEIAHHITRKLYPLAKQAHGPEFRSVMQAIGYDGSTYHTMNPKAAKRRAIAAKDELFQL